jgi:predicted ester cyclase
MALANVTMVETNRAIARRFFEEQDRLRGGPAEALCAPEYRAVIGGHPAMSREGHEGFAKAFYAAFPDAKHTIEDVLATDEGAAVRFIIHGTHTGSYFGIPATQRAVVVVANIILQVRDGKVTKLFGVFDEAGLLRQIGVLPTA